LHSYAKNDKITLKSILQLDNFQSHFHLLLSEEAYEQFCDIHILLQTLQPVGEDDHWSYIWGNQEYSIKKHINIYLDMPMFTQLLNGFGSPVKLSKRYFSYYYCKTD
jgi:hypothetical protein